MVSEWLLHNPCALVVLNHHPRTTTQVPGWSIQYIAVVCELYLQHPGTGVVSPHTPVLEMCTHISGNNVMSSMDHPGTVVVYSASWLYTMIHAQKHMTRTTSLTA